MGCPLGSGRTSLIRLVAFDADRSPPFFARASATAASTSLNSGSSGCQLSHVTIFQAISARTCSIRRRVRSSEPASHFARAFRPHLVAAWPDLCKQRVCRYVVIFKFDTLPHLNLWLNNSARRSIVKEARDIFDGSWKRDMEIKYGSIVPVNVSTPSGDEGQAPLPPSLFKITFLLHINVSRLFSALRERASTVFSLY